jgi:putative resolvase
MYEEHFRNDYINAKQIRSKFDIATGTLRRWADEGKISCIRPNGTKRLYKASDVCKVFATNEAAPIKNKVAVCYARVSSQHQKEDLERQIELFTNKFPGRKIYRDIGSGLNWKRPGLMSLLDEVVSGNISEITVAYRDRLCRFGFELLEWLFYKNNIKLVVLNTYTDAATTSPSIELAEDLLAITTVFVAKNNGLRAGKYRKERRNEEANEAKKEKEAK